MLLLMNPAQSEARCIFNEARANQASQRIFWFSLLVDCSRLQPFREIHREYSRLPQGSRSLRSLTFGSSLSTNFGVRNDLLADLETLGRGSVENGAPALLVHFHQHLVVAVVVPSAQNLLGHKHLLELQSWHLLLVKEDDEHLSKDGFRGEN